MGQIAGWWFGTNNPNWPVFFGGQTTNQQGSEQWPNQQLQLPCHDMTTVPLFGVNMTTREAFTNSQWLTDSQPGIPRELRVEKLTMDNSCEVVTMVTCPIEIQSTENHHLWVANIVIWDKWIIIHVVSCSNYALIIYIFPNYHLFNVQSVNCSFLVGLTQRDDTGL